MRTPRLVGADAAVCVWARMNCAAAYAERKGAIDAYWRGRSALLPRPAPGG